MSSCGIIISMINYLKNLLDKTRKERAVVLHHGVYKKTTSTLNGIFIITGMTIGAGILGIPYVIAQVGIKIGLAYILGLGFVMMFLNLMIGEIAVRTKKPMHIPGFAGHYIGNWAKNFLTVLVVLSSTGALLAYMVGEGRTLSAIFGGEPLWWSVFFWSIGSFFIWKGLETAKTVEKYASLTVIILIVGLAFFLFKYIEPSNLTHFNISKVFLPYGVILFALNSTSAIAESHALLPGEPGKFRRAVFFGTLIPIIVYVLFAFAVVGVTGLQTTEVATIGLGQILGENVLLVSNIFASLAMFTGFVGIGIALKQSLVWDHKVSPVVAELGIVAVPLLLLLIGINNFVKILDIVGGLFISLEAIFMVIVYWIAKNRKDLEVGQYNLHYIWLLMVPVFLVFTFATVFSIIKMF